MDEINFTQYKLKKAETVIVDLTQVDEQSDMENKKEELKVTSWIPIHKRLVVYLEKDSLSGCLLSTMLSKHKMCKVIR